MIGISFLIPLYLADIYDLAAAEIGLLVTVHAIALFISIRVGGTLADGWSNGRLVTVSLSMQTTTMIYFALLPGGSIPYLGCGWHGHPWPGGWPFPGRSTSNGAGQHPRRSDRGRGRRLLDDPVCRFDDRHRAGRRHFAESPGPGRGRAPGLPDRLCLSGGIGFHWRAHGHTIA